MCEAMFTPTFKDTEAKPQQIWPPNRFDHPTELNPLAYFAKPTRVIDWRCEHL